MKAARLLFLFALGILTGPAALHADNKNFLALNDQGFFYGPLPGTENNQAHDVRQENDMDEFVGFLSKNSWNHLSLTPLGGVAFASFKKDEWHGEGRGLSSTEENFSFHPVVGFDIAHPVYVTADFVIMPEAYAIYRHDMLNGVQAGFSLGMQMTEDMAARLSLDSNLRPQQQDHRAIFYVKYRW